MNLQTCQIDSPVVLLTLLIKQWSSSIYLNAFNGNFDVELLMDGMCGQQKYGGTWNFNFWFSNNDLIIQSMNLLCDWGPLCFNVFPYLVVGPLCVVAFILVSSPLCGARQLFYWDIYHLLIFFSLPDISFFVGQIYLWMNAAVSLSWVEALLPFECLVWVWCRWLLHMFSFKSVHGVGIIIVYFFSLWCPWCQIMYAYLFISAVYWISALLT